MVNAILPLSNEWVLQYVLSLKFMVFYWVSASDYFYIMAQPQNGGIVIFYPIAYPGLIYDDIEINYVSKNKFSHNFDEKE